MRSSPPKRQTLAELRELQRMAGSFIFRPLDADFNTQKTWTDGREAQAFVSKFIKPNDRLTSFERLEIYNRQYWYRLVDSFYEDFPGLLAILGNEKFSRLSRAYIAAYPSRSFTLRNLGRNLPKFLTDEPQWARPYEAMARDMARFEWAQVQAFDGPSKPPLNTDDLLGRDPAQLRLGLQPYLTLLDLAYPLDQFSVAVKRRGQALRAEASNAVDENSRGNGAHRPRRLSRPRQRRTFVAVHRHENNLYFKRLPPAAYGLLTALAKGHTLTQACDLAAPGEKPRTINQWFANWMSLGWFCKPDAGKAHD
jgi:Putative DNA-binding domain